MIRSTEAGIFKSGLNAIPENEPLSECWHALGTSRGPKAFGDLVVLLSEAVVEAVSNGKTDLIIERATYLELVLRNSPFSATPKSLEHVIIAIQAVIAVAFGPVNAHNASGRALQFLSAAIVRALFQGVVIRKQVKGESGER